MLVRKKCIFIIAMTYTYLPTKESSQSDANNYKQIS